MKLIALLLTITTLSYANPIVVGISGGSGAGKSTIVKAIREQLDDTAVINMDSYYRDLSHLDLEERKKINYDDPAMIEVDLIREHIRQLKSGMAIKQPKYNFQMSIRDQGTEITEPAQIIFVDGFLLLVIPEIRELCDFKVFIDVDDIERVFRVIDRDLSERGYTLEEVKQRYINYVQPCYQCYISDSKYQADIIIPNGIENNRAFQTLLKIIKSG